MSEKYLEKLKNEMTTEFSKKNYSRAKKIALELNHRTNRLVHLSDAVTCMIFLGEWDEVIKNSKIILKNTDRLSFEYINALDGLSHASHVKKDMHSVRKYGSKSLEIKDEIHIKENKKYKLIDGKSMSNGINVISFSLYGVEPKYNFTAIINVILSKRIYPDWTCRFYIDNTVPLNIRESLIELGSELFLVNSNQKKLPGTTWRFLAADDPYISRVIFRDADSLISERERHSVNEWEDSGKAFHIIRDAGSHTSLIMAGLFGMITKKIPNMEGMLYDYLSDNDHVNDRYYDQNFLSLRIWGYMRQDLMTHTNIFEIEGAKEIPSSTNFLIGSNEFVFKYTVTLNDHVNINNDYYLELHSRYSPYIDLQGQQEIYDKERLIGVFQLHIIGYTATIDLPLRFSHGIKNNYSRVNIYKKRKNPNDSLPEQRCWAGRDLT